MTNNKGIVVVLISLIAVFFLFELTTIDLTIQNYFYNDISHKWLLIHKKGSLLDICFYTGIKIAIIIFGVFILSLYVYSFKSTAAVLREYRDGLLLVWLSIAIIPLIVGTLKSTTNVPCPYDFTHFGGEYPYIRVLDSMPHEIVKRFKCYPAGHASGGFALMSLFFLFKEKKNRYIALAAALIIGWSMGLYKMFIGHHYMSHTVMTMMLAWLIILIIRKTIHTRFFTH